ncbi:MAG: hypothetical protein WDM88_07750 [Galbitalea sp.]
MLLSTVGLAVTAAAAANFRETLSQCERAFAIAERGTTQNQSGSRAIAHSLAAWASIELLERGRRAPARRRGRRTRRRAARRAARTSSATRLRRRLLRGSPQKRRVAQEFVMSCRPATSMALGHDDHCVPLLRSAHGELPR